MSSATSDQGSESQALSIACPRCARDTVYGPGNRFRPFCSERCKLNDLGDWASERYRLPGDEVPPEEAS
ncbi:MAG: DNA gyrase inhibitor YacG [Betaproteobacteria bacterium]|nr:DNA gyrase inhibitor YacG [Betaproteobacteria bacterium]